MKYIVSWRLPQGTYNATIARFLKGGGEAMFQRALLLTALVVFSFSSISAQGQAAEIDEYVRDVCLKVTPGKGAELAKMLHDVGAKLARAEDRLAGAY